MTCYERNLELSSRLEPGSPWLACTWWQLSRLRPEKYRPATAERLGVVLTDLEELRDSPDIAPLCAHPLLLLQTHTQPF